LKLQVFVAYLKLEGTMLFHMSESFRSAREFEGLVISAGLERLGGTIARALKDLSQDVGVLLFFIPVLLRLSRQFIEVFRD
jgi:hypothetical protein